MTDIIIKRYRPEEFPRHLDFLERMTVTRGTVEDWHALKSLHYKTDGKPFAPTYYRCELDGRLVGVVVMACLLYTSPSPRDQRGSRMPSSA